MHYLDASAQEEASTPLQLLLMFSFLPSAPSYVQAMRMMGLGELNLAQLKELVKVFICYLSQPFKL